MRFRGVWLIATLPLLLGACEGEALVTPGIPALPSYIESLDVQVQQLLRDAQAELLNDPSNGQRWMDLGMAFEAHQEGWQAALRYRQAVKIRPDDPKWWYRLAMAQELSDEVEEALDSLARSIELNGNYAPSHWRCGQWKLEMGETEVARAFFERALIIDPTCDAALAGLAQVHVWLGEYEEAIALLERDSLISGPSGKFLSGQIGIAYQRMGNSERARHFLARADNAKPHFSDPWRSEIDHLGTGLPTVNRQARQWISTGQAQRAVVELEKAHALDPSFVPILRTLGAAYSATGQTAKSLDALHRALLLEPENIELRVDATWARAIDGDLEGALVDVDAILIDAPSGHKAHALRSQVLLDLRRGEEAIAAFELAMRYGQRNPRMLVDIGRAQIELQRFADSLASFTLAVEQEPGLQSAWIGQGIAAVELQDLDTAQAAITRAAALTPLGSNELPIITIVRDQIDSMRVSSPSLKK
ncbi:MAG: tetratricopeptide (TPR) repeat protein [Planctomycetota bacterium]|jgi:tetratricopeptide (TPR) repeat protein